MVVVAGTQRLLGRSAMWSNQPPLPQIASVSPGITHGMRLMNKERTPLRKVFNDRHADSRTTRCDSRVVQPLRSVAAAACP